MLDLATCLFMDFEARSKADIKKVGAHAYAEHPSTEVLCCAWVVGMDAPVQLWLPGDEVPAEWDLLGLTGVAHNKDTEDQLLRQKFGIAVREWVDTATLTSAAGMPRNLHDVAESLHLEVQKLAKTALLALAKPRKLTRKNSEMWWTREDKPELYQQLYEYCVRDTDLLRHVIRALPPLHWVLPPREMRLAALTDKMNALGVEVDLAGVALAKAAVAEHTDALRAQFADLVPGVNPRSPERVAAALSLDNARKDTVRDALKLTEKTKGEFNIGARRLMGDDRYMQALSVLKTLKTAATGKLEAFERRTTRDGLLHGAMVFHGAGRTGRWSSVGVQLHNFIRGLGSSTPDWPAVDTADGAQERAFAALHSGAFSELYENPTRTVAAMMGGFIVDRECGFLSGDYSQIEARVLVKWAGQEDMVQAFVTGQDPYRLMASRIYDKPKESINSDERFMGKRTVLGAGYGVGPKGFQRNLKMDFDLSIPYEDSERIVYAYRNANKRVVALWHATERLVKQCILEQWQTLTSHPDVPRIAVRMVQRWLVIRLPSGRCLWYFEPELIDEGQRTPTLYYWGRDITKGGRWDFVHTYGGKLVENITQAIAREVMAEAMLRLDERGMTPRLTVHDEIVSRGVEEQLPEFESTMLEPVPWWRDLPLAVDAQWMRRYTK